MSQVVDVKKRMIDSLYNVHISDTARQMDWDRDLVVEMIALCGGEPETLRKHWMKWTSARKEFSSAKGKESQKAFMEYLRAETSV